MALIKTNKELDGLIVLIGIVGAFLAFTLTALVLICIGKELPQSLIDMFQQTKELMLLVAGYFFRKGLEVRGNGGDGS